MSRHGHMNKYRYKNIISLLFSLMVTLASAAGLMAAVIINGICNPELLNQCINESSYYDDNVKLVTERLADRLKESGLPESMAEDVVSGSNVVIDMNQAVSSRLKGNTGYRVDTSRFEEQLTAGINNYYAGQGVDTNDRLDQATELFVRQAGKEYASLIDYEDARYFTAYSEKYTGICKTAIYVCAGIVLVSLIMMVIIHRRKYRGVRYINYGLISGTILAIMLNVLLKSRLADAIENDPAVNADIMGIYISDSFSQGMNMCLFGVILSVMVLGITLYLRKKAI